MAVATSVKERAIRALEALPEDASWDDVRDTVRYWQSIERGLEDMRSGRMQDHDEVMRELGLDPV